MNRLAGLAPAYAVSHRGWPEPERVVLPVGADRDHGVVVTNRSLLRHGRRWIPVSGEIHYSRLPRAQWPLAVQLLRAGGIDLVSTYVFWNHHQPEPDVEPDFTGGLDVGAFLRLCAEESLPVVVRIGPWCHGETRYGGFPDWVQHSGFANRTDDPGYLALVEAYVGHLARQVAPWCGPDGPVVAVQVENELYDQPQHLATLKSIAQRAGISAPLWTATAWGNAQLPLPEVFPVYSGYSEGFWVDAEDGWDPSFRSHFLFSDRWDDPGVGKDLAGDAWTGTAGARHPDLPPATCELAGGMAGAYHRRPVPSALDIAALANVKLGSGSAWQGYYMYVGGTNPDGPDGLQESHATGYPNDLPRFNYDFHAPVGRDLRTRESFHRLRLQHAFLDAFGDRLAAMTATFPAPPGPDRPLRWSLRADGRSGFVFVNDHQPVEPLSPVPDVRFEVRLGDDRIVFPPEPVTVPADAVLALPLNLDVAGVTIRWATLNLVGTLEAEEPVLVAHAHPGLDAVLAVPADHRVEGTATRRHGDELVATVTPGTTPVAVQAPDGRRLHVLVLDPTQSLQVWVPVVEGRRQLVLSGHDIVQRGGGLVALTGDAGAVEVFEPGRRTWTSHHVPAQEHRPTSLGLRRPWPGTYPPRRSSGGRASAPTRSEVAEHGACYTLAVDGFPPDVERATLVVDLVADVAQISLAGQQEPFDDLYFDGEPWTVDLTRFAGRGPLSFEVRLTALDPEASIRLPPDVHRTVRQSPPDAAIHAADLRLSRAVPLT